MNKDDHLNTETSVSGELTPTSIKASAKSRFVAAVDRFGGNLFELMNAPIEAKVSERRAIADSRVLAIEAVTALGLDRLKTDPDFAERAIRNHLDSVFARQENKDAVLTKTIDDLRAKPPTDVEANSGADSLDESFVRRFDRFAEAATTEELREKWGRVLAQEIRTPSTFSAKVLRVVDELEPTIATLFERVCEHRLDNVLPKVLSGELTFSEVVQLVSADLLVDPGNGQIRIPNPITDKNGDDFWLWRFGKRAIAASRSKDPVIVEGKTLQLDKDKKPCLPVYVLTAVGAAIATILPDNSAKAIDVLAPKISEALPTADLRIYELTADGRQLLVVQTIPPQRTPAASPPT
ncbi:DUF2806 domain-containing protein [Mesorhizobium sp. M0092]|uniref:DUF2806 domain-containing protein n=1 Tax=unclassified Mesorhizobium TaxID=325217 RepID=UPI00333ABF80